jgi:predicted alpha/beta-fold hydrolase
VQETRPAWWIPGAHLQTAWARLARSRRLVTFRREVLTTHDNDDVILDHTDGPAGTPRVLLLHGLEGSAYSLHTQGLARLVGRAGWRTTVLNFRSCARDPRDIRRRLPNRRPRLYHFGETEDLDLVVRHLHRAEPAAPLLAVGFSLGGNVLLKWLGERGASHPIRAAATISVPYDLAAAARYLDRPVGRLYTANFMGRLRAKALQMLARFPRETAHLDAQRIRGARTFGQLDACLTTPLYGFASVDDYYTSASSVHYLPLITTPTLCVSSRDDPFFPAGATARAQAIAAPAVQLTVTSWGGHTGFVTGRLPWRPTYWAEEAVMLWLTRAG